MFFDKNILIVDDAPIVGKLMTMMLSDSGFKNLTTANCVDDAVELFDSRHFDVVFSDYNMPGKDGGVLLNYVKDKKPETIVIMLSAQTEREIVVTLMRRANNYIIKEDIFKTKEEILFILNQAFEMQQLKQQNNKLVQEITERNKVLEEDLEMAAFLIKDLYPDQIWQVPGFTISPHYWPLDIVGGDFYDVRRIDENRVGVIVADLCGHGVSASLLLFTLKNSLDEILDLHLSPRETAEQLNNLLNKRFPAGHFATISYLVLDEKNRNIVYVTMTDNPILYLKENRTVEELKNGLIYWSGIIDTNKAPAESTELIVADTLELKKDEKLLIFTDGIKEAVNENGEQFELERLKEFILANQTQPVDTLIIDLHAHVEQFANGKIIDDVTIIGIELA